MFGGGQLSSIRKRKEGSIKKVSSFLTTLDRAAQDAEKTKQEIESVRGELDEIEAEADKVLKFVDNLPKFGGGQ